MGFSAYASESDSSLRHSSFLVGCLSPFNLLIFSVSIPSAFSSFMSACARVRLWLIFSSSNLLNFSVYRPSTFTFELSALSLPASLSFIPDSACAPCALLSASHLLIFLISQFLNLQLSASQLISHSKASLYPMPHAPRPHRSFQTSAVLKIPLELKHCWDTPRHRHRNPGT